MATTNKLKEGLEDRIQKRLEVLKSKKAYISSLTNPLLPSIQKKHNEEMIASSLKILEENIPDIKIAVKQVRKHFINIWDQTGIVAAYLLLGKAVSNLETLVLLAKKGHSLEMVEIARSGVESIVLAFLLLEENQENAISKWFKGGVIGNEESRKLLHKVLNRERTPEKENTPKLSIEDAKRDTYSIYSLFTHSAYMALLDSVDVFNEDIDYERNAGLHYANKNLHLIDNLAVNIIFELKNLFNKVKDMEGFDQANKVLNAIGYENASAAEIEEIFEKYLDNQEEKQNEKIA